MNPKNLLKIQVYLKYYKKDITDRYGVMLNDFSVDNDVLDNLTKRLYITTLDKQIKMEQENKQLKDNWNKLKEFVLKKQAVLFNTEYTCYSNILDKMQELEQGSVSNE